MCSFFKAFLHTANCDLQILQMTTNTAKCKLRMAQPAKFLYKKACWNLCSETSSFFVFHVKKLRINMLMKYTPGVNPLHSDMTLQQTVVAALTLPWHCWYNILIWATAIPKRFQCTLPSDTAKLCCDTADWDYNFCGLHHVNYDLHGLYCAVTLPQHTCCLLSFMALQHYKYNSLYLFVTTTIADCTVLWHCSICSYWHWITTAIEIYTLNM